MRSEPQTRWGVFAAAVGSLVVLLGSQPLLSWSGPRYLVVAGALMAIACWAAPAWAFLLLLAYAPFHYWHTYDELLGGRGYFRIVQDPTLAAMKDVLMLPVLVTLGLLAVRRARVMRVSPALGISVVGYGTYLLFVGVLHWNEPWQASLIGLRNTAQYLPLALLVPVIADDAKVRTRATGLLLGCMLVVVALAATEWAWLVWSGHTRIPGNRAVATLLHPNNLGNYLALLACLALGILVGSGRGIPAVSRGLLVGALAAAAFGLFLSGSRSGIFGAFLGIAAIAWVLGKRRWIVGLGLLGLVGVLLLYLYDPVVFNRYTFNVVTAESLFELDWSIRSRLARLGQAWDLFSQSLVTGLGFGWSGNLAALSSIGGPPSMAIHPHNYFLQVMVESGVVGLLLFSWVLAAVLLEGLRAHRQLPDPEARGLGLGVFGAAAACIFIAVTNTVWSNYPVNLLFWSLVGMLSAVTASSTTGSAVDATS